MSQYVKDRRAALDLGRLLPQGRKNAMELAPIAEARMIFERSSKNASYPGGPPSESSCSVSARQTRNATMATVSSCERYSRCISPMFDV